jgi:hypothetical protein
MVFNGMGWHDGKVRSIMWDGFLDYGKIGWQHTFGSNKMLPQYYPLPKTSFSNIFLMKSSTFPAILRSIL